MEFYATLGPACRDEQTLRGMFEAGMTGVRLNLSHVSLAESAAMLEAYRRAAKAAGKRPKLMIDLQGPELRVGALEAPVTLEAGREIILGPGGIPVPEQLLAALKPGAEILLDDGAMLLRAVAVSGGSILCEALRGGLLKSRKSIAAAGFEVNSPALTAADLKNLDVAGDFGVTEVLQPFVRGGRDIADVREALAARGLSNLRVAAKIENASGLEKLGEIIEAADEICIARGDLGNAMPLWELPRVQKRIASRCRAKKKPFIVVTQMLHSMQESETPTRAEVSDVFNAALDGASTLMLTGETAVGRHPVKAVEYLVKTALEAERYTAANP